MAKTVNYTPEMETEIREAFAQTGVEHQGKLLELLSEKFGKSVASIRQKAVRMGVYKKAEYTNKNGEKPETKEAIVSEIAKAMNVNVEIVESLAKANKKTLQLIREAVTVGID